MASAAAGAFVGPNTADAALGHGATKALHGATSKSTWTSHAKFRSPKYEHLRAQFAALTAAPRPAPTRSPMTRVISSHADAGSGSLRDALTNAVDGDIIDLRNVHGTIILASALQTNAKVDIRGPGREQLTIDAGGKDRVFTASHGMRMSNVTIANGASSTNGGCLFAAGYLYLANASITGCKAGDEYSPVAYGGAISVDGGLYLQNVTVTNSSATGYAVAAGGAVSVVGSSNYLYGFDVTINNSTISGNSATVVDSYYSYLAAGGGVAVIGSTDLATYPAYTTITGSTISGNTASVLEPGYGQFYPAAQGGGVNFQGTTASITQSHITGNSISASYYAFGGGVSGSSPVTIVSSAVSGNSGVAGFIAYGGGVFSFAPIDVDRSSVQSNTTDGFIAVGGGINSEAPTTISNSVISGNVAGVTGGVYTTGGGVSRKYNPNIGPASTTLTNNTISGNGSAGPYSIAGGVYEQESLTVNNSTIAFNTSVAFGGGVTTNSASLITLYSTIISNNTAGTTASADLYAYGGPITAAGDHNLIIASDSGVTLPGDTLTDDPMLLPLANNGGPTQTHALDPASPAVDTGSNPLALATDQRGVPYARVVGAAADIGAYELDTDHIFGNGFE